MSKNQNQVRPHKPIANLLREIHQLAIAKYPEVVATLYGRSHGKCTVGLHFPRYFQKVSIDKVLEYVADSDAAKVQLALGTANYAMDVDLRIQCSTFDELVRNIKIYLDELAHRVTLASNPNVAPANIARNTETKGD